MCKLLEFIFAILLSPIWLLGFMYAIAKGWFKKGQQDLYDTNWEI